MSKSTDSNDRVKPEVSEKPIRRRFTAEYKARILEEVDRCTQPGQIGELLRREGLYSSHLTSWRRQRDEGLSPKRRGRKPLPNKKERQELERLRRENKRLAERLRKAEIVIDVQKKVSEMLGTPMTQNEDENNE